MDPLRVLIIDGHPAVGRALRNLLDCVPDLQVVALAERGEHGLRQALAEQPDAALVDAELPGMSSCVVIRLLRTWLPRLRVIALGTYPRDRRPSLAAGAHDFVLKDAGCEALDAAIRGGHAGPDADSTERRGPS